MPLRTPGGRARGANILVATPGRLEDLAHRRLLDLSAVRILVLDEADRMLDMGFKPQVDKIVRLLPSNRQTMFFSATLDGEVGELARAYTSSPSRFEADLPRRPRRRRDRAPLRRGEPGHEGRDARRAHPRERRAHARLRPDEARRRPAREEAGVPPGRRGRHARRPVPGPAAAGAAALRDAARCRFSSRRTSPPAASTSTTSPRDQLRPAGGGQGLRPPHRPHRARGTQRDRDHVRPSRPAGRDEPRRQPARAPGAVRAGGPEHRARRSSSTRAAAAGARSGRAVTPAPHRARPL